jgi:hypothetical protein
VFPSVPVPVPNFLKVELELELLEFTLELELELFKKHQFHKSVPLFSLLQKFINYRM